MGRSWSLRRWRLGPPFGEMHLGAYASAFVGVVVGVVLSFATFYISVRPIQRSHRIVEAEKEIFILTATLLWGIIIQEAVAHFFTNNAKTVAPIVEGVVTVFGVRTPANEFFTGAVCWIVIGLLWLLVNKTRRGKAVLAASMNPRGVTLLGIELSEIHLARMGGSTDCSPASRVCCWACSWASAPTAWGR